MNVLSVREKFQVSGVKELNFYESDHKAYHKLEEIQEIGEYKFNRTFDLVVSIIGVMAHLLLFPLFAICIKLSSKGPVLFKQKRTGKMGKEFECYKFRTINLKELLDEHNIEGMR